MILWRVRSVYYKPWQSVLLTYHQGLYSSSLHEQSLCLQAAKFEFPKGRETVRKWTEAELTSRQSFPIIQRSLRFLTKHNISDRATYWLEGPNHLDCLNFPAVLSVLRCANPDFQSLDKTVSWWASSHSGSLRWRKEKQQGRGWSPWTWPSLGSTEPHDGIDYERAWPSKMTTRGKTWGMVKSAFGFPQLAVQERRECHLFQSIWFLTSKYWLW